MYQLAGRFTNLRKVKFLPKILFVSLHDNFPRQQLVATPQDLTKHHLKTSNIVKINLSSCLLSFFVEICSLSVCAVSYKNPRIIRRSKK